MSHVYGMNWEIIHELLVAEIKRVEDAPPGSGYQGVTPEARQWMLDELKRMNAIAVEKAENQA